MRKIPNIERISEFRDIAHSGDRDAMLAFMDLTGVRPSHTEADGAHSALMLAIDSGSIELVRLLLEKGGANASYATEEGETPFECACVIGSVEICMVLKEYGADPFTRNRFGASPEQYAVERGHQNVVELLRSWH